MTSKVEELLRACVAGKPKDDYVLTRENGKPVKDFRGAWREPCTAAGVAELLAHDLRRSAAKALRRAGVPESVIMATGGWKTAASSGATLLSARRPARCGCTSRGGARASRSVARPVWSLWRQQQEAGRK